MTVSKVFQEQIRAFEGFEPLAYNRDGKWTIGYGNTFYENGTAVKQGDRITRARAETLFSNVLNSFASKVSAAYLKKSVTQNQFDALVSLAYNIGIGAFAGSTLLKKVNQNPNDSTIISEFKRWVYSQGGRLNGLVSRRAKEASWYGSGTAEISILGVLLILALSFIIKKYYYGK